MFKRTSEVASPEWQKIVNFEEVLTNEFRNTLFIHVQ